MVSFNGQMGQSCPIKCTYSSSELEKHYPVVGI
jgi:hypothetical protein